MDLYIQVLGMGVAFGFAGSLFTGMVSWAIAAVCRLFVNIVKEGVKR